MAKMAKKKKRKIENRNTQSTTICRSFCNHPANNPAVETCTLMIIILTHLLLFHEIGNIHLLLGRIKGSASFFFRTGIGGRGPLVDLGFFGARGGLSGPKAISELWAIF